MTNYRIIKNSVEPALEILKALSDSNRIRIFMMLKDQKVCVCHILSLLSIVPSTVSKHLLILKNRGLLDSRKEGRWIYYSRSKKIQHKRSPLNRVIAELDAALLEDTRIKNDHIKLKNALKVAEKCLK